MDAGGRATPGAVAEGWGEDRQRNSGLILSFPPQGEGIQNFPGCVLFAVPRNRMVRQRTLLFLSCR